jgi:putative zinc finger/helix-turn-helix YgiT family protein
MSAVIKPSPRKCATCRERAVSPTVLPTYEAELEHDGRAYQIALSEVPALRCTHCGTIVLGDAADQMLSDALRQQAGLLTPSQIRQGRERHGLTQKGLAAALKISESTVSRWETGAQIQQRSMDLLLRAFFDLEALRRYCGIRSPAMKSLVPAQSPHIILPFPPVVSAGSAGVWDHDPGGTSGQAVLSPTASLDTPAPGIATDGRDPTLAA